MQVSWINYIRFKFACNLACQSGMHKRYSLIDDLAQDCINLLASQVFKTILMDVFATHPFQPHPELQNAFWEISLYHISCILMKNVSKLYDDLVRAHSCRHPVMVEFSQKDALHRPVACS